MKMYSSVELSSNVPAFIAKLWHMVNDKRTNDLIQWGVDGSTFVIHDHVDFASKLLPMYYKHNNMASFIRQLNMYGFHKVVGVESSTLKNDKGELEFVHMHFCRGEPGKLEQIKRKMSHHREIASTEFKGDPSLLNKLLQEVQQLRSRQSAFDSRLHAMKEENDALWREQALLRQKHFKQQKIVNRLIQFLVTLVQQTRGFNIKRKTLPLMLKDGKSEGRVRITAHPHNGPVICEVDPYEVLMDETEESLHGNRRDGSIRIVHPTEIILEPSNATIEMVASSLSPKSDEKRYIKKSEGSARTTTNGFRGIRRKRKFSEVLPPTEENLNEVEPDKSVCKSPKMTDEKPPDLQTDVELIIPDVVSPGGSQILLCDDQGLPLATESFREGDSTDSFRPPIQIPEPQESKSEDVITPNKDTDIPTQDNTAKTDENSDKNLSLVLSGKNLSKEEMDSHVSTIDTDLDILKDILRGEGLSLDANTLIELFSSEDPLQLNLPLNPDLPDQSGSSTSQNENTGSELTSYNPAMVDMTDILNDEEKTSEWWDDDLGLGIPQSNISSLDFHLSDVS